jgi:hypothetical protein
MVRPDDVPGLVKLESRSRPNPLPAIIAAAVVVASIVVGALLAMGV